MIKMKESVIDAIVDHLINMRLPDFDVINSEIFSPKVIDGKEKTCMLNMTITLKNKKQ